MNGIVACTITSKATDIFCIVTIYNQKSDDSARGRRWKRFFGHLFDKCVIANCQYGDQGHWSNGGGKLAIVGEIAGFAVPYAPAGPVVMPDYTEPLTVAELYDVPTDFLDSVTSQNSISGEGNLILTQEKLVWSMWYGTA